MYIQKIYLQKRLNLNLIAGILIFVFLFEYWRGSTSWNDMFVTYFYVPFIIIQLLNKSILIYLKCIHKHYSFKPSISLKEIRKDYSNFRIKQHFQNNQKVRFCYFFMTFHESSEFALQNGFWCIDFDISMFYISVKSCFEKVSQQNIVWDT